MFDGLKSMAGMAGLLKDLPKIQAKAQALREEVALIEVDGRAGGGAVRSGLWSRGGAALLARGEAGRRVRETALNEASSRSHVVMQVGHEDPCAVTRTPVRSRGPLCGHEDPFRRSRRGAVTSAARSRAGSGSGIGEVV